MTERQARRIFNEERTSFARVFPGASAATFRVYARHYLPAKETTDRDVAWFDIDTRQVGITRRALALSEGALRGVIRHELGHAVDARVGEPGCERRADRLACQASGAPIRYTRSGMQHATHGVARRPNWLHQ